MEIFHLKCWVLYCLHCNYAILLNKQQHETHTPTYTHTYIGYIIGSCVVNLLAHQAIVLSGLSGIRHLSTALVFGSLALNGTARTLTPLNAQWEEMTYKICRLRLQVTWHQLPNFYSRTHGICSCHHPVASAIGMCSEFCALDKVCLFGPDSGHLGVIAPQNLFTMGFIHAIPSHTLGSAGSHPDKETNVQSTQLEQAWLHMASGPDSQ